MQAPVDRDRDAPKSPERPSLEVAQLRHPDDSHVVLIEGPRTPDMNGNASTSDVGLAIADAVAM